MRALFVLLAALICFSARAENPTNLKSLTDSAMAGDYQAQRNLAYGYAASPVAGQKKDAQQACAWYLLILRSDSPKLDGGDVGNVLVYCGKLDFTARLAAERKANDLFRKIYRR